MRSRVSSAIVAALLFANPGFSRELFHYQIVGSDDGAWPRILSAIGLVRGTGGVYVLREPPSGQSQEWLGRIEQGAIVVLEGESELADALGFKRPANAKPLPVQSVSDVHNPGLQIVWKQSVDLPRFEVPPEATVFSREKWEAAPLVAGLRRGSGAVLWLAVTPGEQGHERFPYLAQALRDLGLPVPFQTRRLWAFFDASYRSRVDLDYFAARWRKAGIAALHVAAWHFWEANPERDAYLRRLIEACHRQAITVYAWLELPHVSEQFWQDHPEWREKTALGQDAFLDWRKLMDLGDPGCKRAVSQGVRDLIARFDWDGVNLAELYFESLEGADNAARFTPMNARIRGEFASQYGFDPITLFDPASRDPKSLRLFLDWRAGLAHRMQEEWIDEMEAIRASRPGLDLVLTHVDDRYDTRMRDLIGADAARLLPLLDSHDFTFLVEDPATLWNLGPERYPEIAARYAPLVSRPSKLAIDINIVERYQDVYPTKQQTGTDLFQLVHLASQAFPRVALYFESSILTADLELLSSAAAVPARAERAGARLVVESPRPIGVPWTGPALVDGQRWPYTDGATVWLPSGAHAVEAAGDPVPIRLLDFSSDAGAIISSANGFEMAYQSDSRAYALLDKLPGAINVDGEPYTQPLSDEGGRWLVCLPRGQHVVAITVQ